MGQRSQLWRPLVCAFVGFANLFLKSNEVNKVEVVRVCCDIRKMLLMLHINIIMTKKKFYSNISKKKAKKLPRTKTHILRSHTISSANVKQTVTLEFLFKISILLSLSFNSSFV